MGAQPNETREVVVIGGGPAGSTAATLLAAKGIDVLLLEREHFPRPHVGESLLPASLPILERLGLRQALEDAGFVHKSGATMVWGTDPKPWSWYFRETNPAYPYSYQVWRPQFDKLLLDNSRQAGVDVREGHQVLEALFEGDRVVGVRHVDDAGEERTVLARHVVDASGQQALLGHRLRLRQWDDFFHNLAVYAYFAGARRLPPPDDGHIFIESYPGGWFWCIPLHTGVSSVGAVVDSRVGQDGMRKAGGAEPFLRAQIALAPGIAQMLSDARLESGPFVVKDWSYVSTEVAGPGYVLAGDAACFADPLFSSGVHLALTAGLLSAAYVATVLRDETMREPAAGVYKDLYYRQYGYYHEMAKLFYSSNRSVESYFWEARRILGGDGRYTPRESFIRAVAGQPPQGYERAVIEHGDAPEDFRTSVEAARTDLAERRAHIEAAMRPAPGSKEAALLAAVPRLAEGVSLVRRPVLGSGEFVWGRVVVSPARPDGVPVIDPVAHLLQAIDGRTPVRDLVRRMLATVRREDRPGAERAVLMTLRDLFVEGAIELRGPQGRA